MSLHLQVEVGLLHGSGLLCQFIDILLALVDFDDVSWVVALVQNPKRVTVRILLEKVGYFAAQLRWGLVYNDAHIPMLVKRLRLRLDKRRVTLIYGHCVLNIH